MLWLHNSAGEFGFLPEFIETLQEEVDRPVSVLCTSATNPSDALPDDVIFQAVPEDSPAMVARFIEHWRPDAALWIGFDFRPVLLDAAHRAAIPLSLATVGPADASPGEPGAPRALLSRFDQLLSPTVTLSEWARRQGYPAHKIEVTGALESAPPPLACNEAERADLAELIGNRPIWLAVCPSGPEVVTVLEAHRRARGIAHRLLLIMVLDEAMDSDRVAQRLRDEGWHLALRSEDEDPLPDTEIFLVDSTDELGLWYRLAPLCYLGGTLAGEGCPCPMRAAGLGSAIIAGPQPCGRDADFARLANADAVTRIDDPPDLGGAVIELLSPDKAALQSLNAWSVATDGADALRKIVSAMVRQLSDETV